MILTDFTKALSQLGDPRFRKVLLLGVGLTVALLVVTYAAFLALIQWLVGPDATLPLIGPVTPLCRPKCSFRPHCVRKRPDFSNPVLNGDVVAYKSR